MGCHFLLQCMKVKSESEVAQLCLTLSDPMDCSPPGSSARGIFQARVLEWGVIAFSLGWAIIPQDWGPCKKKRSGHRHTQRDDPVRTWGGDGRLHAQEGSSGGPAPPTLGSRIPASRPGDSDCLMSKPLGCGVCYDRPAD